MLFPTKNKVIVVASNNVFSDSRVRKCATTLQNSNYDVILLGIGTKLKKTIIDGTHAKLFPEPLLLTIFKNIFRKFNKMRRALMIGAFTTAAVTMWTARNYIDFQFDYFNTFAVLLLLAFFMLIIKIINQFAGKVQSNIGEKIIWLGYHIAAKRLGTELAKHGRCVIHAHDIVALIAAVNAKKMMPSIVIVWDAHEIYTELSYKSKSEITFIEQTISSSAPLIDHFITINESIAAYYAAHFPELPEAVVVMNAARKFDETTQKIDLMRTKHNIAANQKILLFQGGLGKNRGINTLLEVAKALPREWSIVFMGDGSEVHKINKLMKKLNNDREKNRPAIRLIPTVPYSEITNWTASATIGAITYENSSLNHYYCTPNKLWEYPNACVPIIATSLPEMSKIIERHEIGILLPINFDLDDVILAIKELNENKLRTLRENCLKFKKTENWEKYEPQILNVHAKARLN